MRKLMKQRIHIVSERIFNTKTEHLFSKMWPVIRSAFTLIERDHDLNDEESIQVDKIMRVILKEVHELNFWDRRRDARLYQKQ